MKKPLIKSIEMGVNEFGYMTAFVDCHSKELYIAGKSISTSNHPKAKVFIAAHKDGYLCESIDIPFQPETDMDYTIVSWSDKDQISIMIVPFEFIVPKHTLEC